MKNLSGLFILPLLLLSSVSVRSQSSVFTNPIFQHLVPKFRDELPRELQKALSVKAQVTEFQIRSQLDGQSAGHVVIKLQIESFQGFHVYKERLESVVDPSSHGKWQLKLLQAPSTVRFLDPVTSELKEGYRGQNEFLFEAKLQEGLSAPPTANDQIQILTGFQICNKEVCLLPAVLKSEVKLALSVAEKPSSIFSRVSDFLKKRASAGGDFSVITLLILFGAGLITAFTPCVYPLYPITLGIFGRWSESAHVSSFLLALVYCASMTLSYAVLGLFTAATGSIFGSFTQTPTFLLGVGVVILLSSIFFSGLVQIPVPNKLINLLGKAQPNTNKKASTYYLQSAVMGFSLGIVGSPCVGPVLLSLLAWLGTAISQEGGGAYFKGFVLLSVFGLGMSAPFLVIGHFVLKMHQKPKLGFITPWAKGLGAVVMAASSLFFIIPGVNLLRAKSAPYSENFPVLDLQEYKSSADKKWTVIDFRADWCAACVQIERETFSQKQIAELFLKNEWQMVKIDMTLSPPDLQSYAQEMGVLSLPSVLIVSPEGKICKNEALHEFENANNFSKRLKRAQQSCTQ